MKFKRIYIEITNQCNLNCSFCHNTKRKKQQMTKQNFEKILKKVKAYTDTIYLHVKGEPLLHQDLSTFLDLASLHSLKVNITTNATLLEKNVSMLKEKTCIKHLNISLHCEQKDSNYLENVFSACDQLKDKVTIIYRIWTLKDDMIDQHTKEIINSIAKHYQLDQKKLSTIAVEKNIELIPKVYLDKENQFTWPSLEDEGCSDGYCYGLKSHLAILVDGSVVPCCLDGEGEIILGNILKEELDSILSRQRTISIIEGFQQRKAIEPLCQRCSYKKRF